MLHRFWVRVIWVPKLKISVCMCGRKIWVLCKLWWTVQKFHYEALKTLKMLWFPAFANGPCQGCYLDPARGFTACRAPKFHWQITITHRGSPPKLIFQNSHWFVYGFIVLCMFVVIKKEYCKWKHWIL